MSSAANPDWYNPDDGTVDLSKLIDKVCGGDVLQRYDRARLEHPEMTWDEFIEQESADEA